MSTSIYPVPGSIKSIQRGIGTCGATVNISAVNPSKSLFELTGWARGNANPCEVRATLASSTTITSLGNDSTATFGWQVTEYN